MSEKHIGKVLQVIGPVLDIQFEDGQLPELLNAIEIDNHGEKLVVEVAQHTGDNVVRCIAMNSTDGLVRGTEAVDTGEPIKVPVGDQCLGRVFNLLGEPVDNKPAPTPEAYWPIHRPAPSYEEQQSTTEISAASSTSSVNRLASWWAKYSADRLPMGSTVTGPSCASACFSTLLL